jgi:hypothetical protein
MNLDPLEEAYPMVKSKLYFVDFDHTGLTGGTHRSDRSDQTRGGATVTPMYSRQYPTFLEEKQVYFKCIHIHIY